MSFFIGLIIVLAFGIGAIVAHKKKNKTWFWICIGGMVATIIGVTAWTFSLVSSILGSIGDLFGSLSGSSSSSSGSSSSSSSYTDSRTLDQKLFDAIGLGFVGDAFGGSDRNILTKE